VSEEDAKAMFHAAVGAELPLEVISRGTWTAGHCLVADKFQHGRIFIAGDAAHLFTPTGGLGYNTAVDDAVNLGWKLAAVLRSQASPSLLDSYALERRPLAERNTRFARGFADSLGLFEPESCIEDETVAGAAARARAGEVLGAHGRAEFNIPGITFGGRCDGSPAIVPDGSGPPPDAADRYVPSACPGGRAPHLWLRDGASLYDRFGFEWTLLQLGGDAAAGDRWQEAARRRTAPLQLFGLQSGEARDLYAADLVLIRPDQVVAWRGTSRIDPEAVFTRLLGNSVPQRRR
jgi:hypothetical protein